MADLGLSDDELTAAEARFQQALSAGDAGDLEVLGYGEISTVAAIEAATGRFAVKRLPPFADRSRFESYRALFREYLERLGEAGVRVVRSRLRSLPGEGGRTVAYCVQPVLDRRRLGPRVLAACTPHAARAHFEEISGRILSAVSPEVGLDGQLSNWARCEDGWVYLDVTTPLLRDGQGRDRLDAGLFLAMLPWLLRGVVRQFLLRAITDTYFDPRRVLVDLLANLHKERLTQELPAAIEVANDRLAAAVTGADPITAREVRAYYAADARMWSLLLWLRRADRFWHLRVRRRPYPYLLPGRIER